MTWDYTTRIWVSVNIVFEKNYYRKIYIGGKDKQPKFLDISSKKQYPLHGTYADIILQNVSGRSGLVGLSVGRHEAPHICKTGGRLAWGAIRTKELTSIP